MDLAAVLYAGSGQRGADTAPRSTLRVLSANVGNLGSLSGADCPGEPYAGALCSVAQEQIIAQQIRLLDPDLIFLMEVLEAGHCDEQSWEGDADLPCSGAPERVPYQQARRLVGDSYTLSSDAIAHYTWVALKQERGSLAQCPSGEECVGGNTTPEHPWPCRDIGTITNVSSVDATIDGQPITVVAVHPLNAIGFTEDSCRAAQYVQAFEQLAGDLPVVMAGDMNMDPYRISNVLKSGIYWRSQVGPGHRFRMHDPWQDDLPVTTWGDTVTLDYVLSDFLTGECVVLGTSEGTERLDGPDGQMDHRALFCELTW